ncbi:MAG: hypothetical protein M2R45_02459 [Verrucomicrobia subdivision 3 bacterium]|nr:hypothetical protein [Limisphaerales bacterium]MCS1413248.1 hypothetical protein [Limisphaerales bacterium]
MTHATEHWRAIKVTDLGRQMTALRAELEKQCEARLRHTISGRKAQTELSGGDRI